MNQPNIKKVNLTSANLSDEKITELHRVIPEVFSEGRIDWDKLRATFGEEIDTYTEKFNFTWAGKGNAIKNVLIPSRATLNPAPDESVKFDDSDNLFIEGDNLEVLKLLQKAYFEKIKVIYIDPPYNTGGDFIYNDNFTSPIEGYLKQTGQKNGNGDHLTTNKETNGRFHSDWLSMMYPRLKLAWNLLRDDGVLFVSIDDNEIHHLRMVLNEIFGEENFIGTFKWNRVAKAPSLSTSIRTKYEYVVAYYKEIRTDLFGKDSYNTQGPLWHLPNKRILLNFPAGSITVKQSFRKGDYGGTYKVELLDDLIEDNGCNKNAVRIKAHSAWSQPRINKYIEEGFTFEIKKNPTTVYTTLSSEGNFIAPSDLITKEECGVETNTDASDAMKMMGIPFDFPKPTSLIRFLINMVTYNDKSAIILDFFAGSGTTAHAVMEQNKDGGDRKWICVQLPEKTTENSEAFKAGYKTIADIGKERIRRAIKLLNNQDGFKVFKLAESNYPENTFEFDPEKSEEENKTFFEDYLKQSKTARLINNLNETSIIYENIIKEGFSLNSNIAVGDKGGNKIFIVADADRQFSICLDRHIDDATIRVLTNDAKGITFICFDSALTDTQKANLGLHLELKTI